MSLELTPIPTGLTYAYYLSQGGQLDESAFEAALPRATAAVDAAIWPNVVADDTQDAYDRAVCAAIDADPEGLGQVVASERIGKTSVDYSSAGDPVGRAIVRHLTGTGLLYRGL